MKIYKKFRLSCSVWLILFVLFTCVPLKNAMAIDNNPGWWTAEFELNQPGARSRGIGGAFVGRADDATAALFNPAGLAQLPGIQLYIEGRLTDWDTINNSWFDPSQVQFESTIAPTPVTTTREVEVRTEDKKELSFACIAFPLKYKEFDLNVNAAVFFNKLSNKDTKMDFPMSVQFTTGSSLGTGRFLLPGFKSSLDIDINEYGISMATGVFKDKIFLGAGISVLELDIRSKFNTTYVDSAGFDFDPNGLVDHANEAISINDTDIDIAWRFGVLYRVTDNLNFGASVQLMPSLKYKNNKYTNVFIDFPALNTGSFETDSSITVPDVFSIGLSYQATTNLGFFVEGKYIEYSDLEKGFDSNWGILYEDFNPDFYNIDDIWEIHVGTEYVINVKETPIALRFGGYYEPAHSLEFKPSQNPTVGAFPEIGQLFADLMDGGDDVMHYTFGVGTVIKNRLQVDFAVDYQDDGKKNVFILSGAYQF